MIKSSKSGPVAQLGARFHGMEEVIGSIPIRSTNFLSKIQSLTPRDGTGPSNNAGSCSRKCYASQPAILESGSFRVQFQRRNGQQNSVPYRFDQSDR